ncbi:uncharacterized protein TNCV_98281 [Trichonephila clavipes]|nr:uncharacterized protein TNCV_98281 [Trichonephila clavipes]
MQSRHLKTRTPRKSLTPDEIANLLREDILLSESDCKESEKSANEIDNIPVKPDIYVAKDDTEWITHNSNVPGRFATRSVLRQSSGPTSFAKHNVNVEYVSLRKRHRMRKHFCLDLNRTTTRPTVLVTPRAADFDAAD